MMRKVLLALALVLCGGAVLEAKTITLDGQGASIDVPDAWEAKPEQADPSPTTSTLILSAISAEKTSMLQVQVCGNPHNLMADRMDLVANIKDDFSNQIISHGGQIQFTGEGKVQINDVPAYLIQYTATTSAPKPILARNYQVAANRKLYLITLRTVDASADGDLQAIANSFRFDSPPVLPTLPVSHRNLKIALAAGAGVILLVGLGIGYYYYQQRQLYV